MKEFWKYFWITFLGGLFIVCISVISIGYKDSIYSFNLMDYEEECIQYKYEPKAHTIKTCLHHTFYGMERRECNSEYWEIDWREPKYERIVEYIKTDECIQYRLVRYDNKTRYTEYTKKITHKVNYEKQ